MEFFNILFFIVPVFVVLIFIFSFLLIFSPKVRAKLIKRQLKAAEYIIDENEETLKKINKKGADIRKEGIKITTTAIKEALLDDMIYCKYCGESINSDSIYCRKCGEKQ